MAWWKKKKPKYRREIRKEVHTIYQVNILIELLNKESISHAEILEPVAGENGAYTPILDSSWIIPNKGGVFNFRLRDSIVVVPVDQIRSVTISDKVSIGQKELQVSYLVEINEG